MPRPKFLRRIHELRRAKATAKSRRENRGGDRRAAADRVPHRLGPLPLILTSPKFRKLKAKLIMKFLNTFLKGKLGDSGTMLVLADLVNVLPDIGPTWTANSGAEIGVLAVVGAIAKIIGFFRRFTPSYKAANA